MMEGDRSLAGKFTPGQALTSWQLNRVADQASRSHTVQNDGVSTIQGPFGTVYQSQQSVSQAQIYDYPFKVTLGAIGNTIQVYVRPGSVNNFMPKIGTKWLDDADRPHLDFTTFTMTNKKIVALKVTKQGVKFFPNTVEVVLLDDDEALVDTDNYGYLQIASISGTNVAGKPNILAIYQIIYASQVVARMKPGTQTAIWDWSSR